MDCSCAHVCTKRVSHNLPFFVPLTDQYLACSVKPLCLVERMICLSHCYCIFHTVPPIGVGRLSLLVWACLCLKSIRARAVVILCFHWWSSRCISIGSRISWCAGWMDTAACKNTLVEGCFIDHLTMESATAASPCMQCTLTPHLV